MSMMTPRWGEEEHRILMEMVDKQFKWEEQTGAKRIPWSILFAAISDTLMKKGFNRPAEACQHYYKR
jgi:hypothetical protein